jgi:carbon storage regulator CsrA
MLVLTRKLDEQILIGDDIKITVLRVRGNSIRIGIEAPRSTRVIRGELGVKEEAPAKTFTQVIDVELDGPCDDLVDDMAEVFAHPESQTIVREKKSRPSVQPTNRIDASAEVSKAELFVGRVHRSGKNAGLISAPLSAFVSTS